MKSLRLDGIYSIDLPAGPPEMPSNPYDCWIVIQADIGILGEIGTDTFTFYFTTPTWLEQRGQIPSSNVIVNDRFDWEAVKHEIEARCSLANGTTWEAIARNLAGEWEYE